MWVTTTGNIQAFRHAGRMGDNLLTHLLGQTMEALKEKVDPYREEWRAAGHPGHGVVTLLAHAFVADNEAVILEHVKEPFKRYLVESVGTPQQLTVNVQGHSHLNQRQTIDGVDYVNNAFGTQQERELSARGLLEL